MSGSEDGAGERRRLPGQEQRPLPKRFYQHVDVAPAVDGAGFAVTLDGRTARTPAKRPLALPTRALADIVAAEWRAQGTHIDPATMPLTRIVNSALDGVAGREPEVRAEIVKYAGSDLLCYFAEDPPALVDRQTGAWEPVHRWADAELGVRLAKAAGVMPVAQSEEALARVAAQLAPLDALSLAAVHVVTTLTGSALLALACLKGRLSPDEAWTLAHIDEDFQIEQWGEDAEAAARRRRRRDEFLAATRVLAAMSS